MAQPEVTTSSITSPAKLESNISVDHVYTDVIMLKMKSCDAPLDAILAPYLPGVGNANLVKLSYKIVTTAAKQKIRIGFCSTVSPLTADLAAMKESGLYFVSNEKTVGDEVVGVLIPEDTLSRQIRPNSAQLVMMKLLVDVPEAASVMLFFYVKVNGMRMTIAEYSGN
jgi:hypothetical protein